MYVYGEAEYECAKAITVGLLTIYQTMRNINFSDSFASII